MRRSTASQSRQSGRPPFDASAARRLRTALGMGPEHVAYGLRASYGLTYVTPDLVLGWERGLSTPTGPEVTALAGVLWCSSGELAGRPRSLREHRLARGLSAEDVARAVGLEFIAYSGMEESDTWRGTERQAALLAGLLELTLPEFVAVTGREPRLAQLLRGAVTSRRAPRVRALARLVPVDRRPLEAALTALREGYREAAAVASDPYGGSADDRGDGGREFLDRIVEHFWWVLATLPDESWARPGGAGERS
ncbi:XRE family transcriptional regulator [Streptomyces sp. NPDC002265]|uniref:XRE family transcriptional regulator n=1 Tax=Streptomyces sp. NPDC002265 TaxID=3154415 RepID=UPI00332FF917